MTCPFCTHREDKVIDSRESKEADVVRRRRECLSCGRRFTTYERIDEIPYMVIKKSGRREKFERQKVLNGLLKACEKRPISVILIGQQPLINLSGRLVPPSSALVTVSLAWASVLPAAFAFTGLAALLSVVTRSSVAGVGIPVVVGLTMQLSDMVDGPEALRRLLMSSAFGAWHGLLTEPPFYMPLVDGIAVSVIYFIVCLAIASRVLLRRDIGGKA